MVIDIYLYRLEHRLLYANVLLKECIKELPTPAYFSANISATFSAEFMDFFLGSVPGIQFGTPLSMRRTVQGFMKVSSSSSAFILKTSPFPR